MDASNISASRRRDFLGHASMLAAAGILGLYRRSADAEPPPETTRIRLVHAPYICLAPQYLAEEFLRLEGFTDWDYFQLGSRSLGIDALANGKADISMWDTHSAIPMLAHVGMNPQEVNWTTGEGRNAMDTFADGKADAFLAFSQEPSELRARQIGHVILNTATDRPWSNYFCCMVLANRDCVQRHPVATKRVLRSILKAADICAADPGRVARFLVDMRYEARYPIGFEVIKSLQFTRWREADPEDTLRFHVLRLREAGMVKSTPQKLIAQGTDWRFLNELKRELKA
jgi:NitT/TauT family transport system substrate-binding protein